MNESTQAEKKHVLLIYRRMIPSIRLCGHAQMEALEAEGRILYRAVQGMRLTAGDLEWAEIALLGRLDSWYELQIAKKLKAAGKTLVYILDDDLLNVPAEMTSASYYNQPVIHNCIREILSLSDAILSPSPVLLERYARDGKTGIRVEEPALAPAEYTPHPEGVPVKIGFAGSVDRTEDLEGILREALMTVREEFGNRVQICFFGGKPAFAAEIGAECIPYTESYDRYRETLNGLEWDIGLAPMPETDFHACKHYNKFVEYAAAGIAGIYSRTGPYRRLEAFRDCAVLCGNTAEEWTEAIRSLVRDREKREQIRQKAAECARGPLSLKRVSGELYVHLAALPEKPPAEKSTGFGPLLSLKAVNVVKRFGTSVKGHGIGGFLKMMADRAAERILRKN